VSGSASEEEIALGAPFGSWYRGAAAVVARDDEGSLVRAAQSGSPHAIEELVRRNWDAAHRTAYLIVHDASAAQDICQEAMLAAVRAIDGFDRRRPFRPWLHRIVVNRALDWLRAHHRRAEVAETPDDAATEPQTPDGRSEASPTTCWPRWPRSIPTTGRSWCCATSSITAQARSARC
jgi:Sigma-70 region 2